MPLFRRRNLNGSNDSVHADNFLDNQGLYSERKSFDTRLNVTKRRPRLFTLSNHDRPKTATGASAAQTSPAQTREKSWYPPPLPKDDVLSAAQIGVALGSPTELSVPPAPQRPPPPLPSPRGRALTMPLNKPAPRMEERYSKGKSEDSGSEIKRWKTINGFFGSKKAHVEPDQGNNGRPSTSAGERGLSRSKSKLGLFGRKLKYTDEPAPEMPSIKRFVDKSPKSSTSLDVSIPNADLGRYSSLFTEVLQDSPKSHTKPSQVRQSILVRRQTGIDNLTIKSPTMSAFHALKTTDPKPYQAGGESASVSIHRLAPIVIEKRQSIRRSTSAGEFLTSTLGTKVLSTANQGRSLSMRTPRTPPLEAFFTQQQPHVATRYSTPQEQWDEDEFHTRTSMILDESYLYLTTAPLSHHDDVSSALLTYAHSQGQLSLDTVSASSSGQKQGGLLAPGLHTSPLPNSPLSFFSAQSFGTPTTPCVAMAREAYVINLSGMPKTVWDDAYLPDSNSPEFANDYDSSEDEENNDHDSTEALGDTAKMARVVVTPDTSRHSFHASLDEYNSLWKSVGEAWGVRASQLGLGLEAGA